VIFRVYVYLPEGKSSKAVALNLDHRGVSDWEKTPARTSEKTSEKRTPAMNSSETNGQSIGKS
jgi:hypothetical protein